MDNQTIASKFNGKRTTKTQIIAAGGVLDNKTVLFVFPDGSTGCYIDDKRTFGEHSNALFTENK